MTFINQFNSSLLNKSINIIEKIEFHWPPNFQMVVYFSSSLNIFTSNDYIAIKSTHVTDLPEIRDGVWERTLGGNIRRHPGVMLDLKGQQETKGKGVSALALLTLDLPITTTTGH